MEPEMPLGGSLWFYSYFHGRGRDLLAEELGDPHPFTLAGSEIVERVLAAGFKPDLDHVQRQPYPTADAVSIVERDGQHFVVSLDAERETISVQEQRAAPYEKEE